VGCQIITDLLPDSKTNGVRRFTRAVGISVILIGIVLSVLLNYSRFRFASDNFAQFTLVLIVSETNKAAMIGQFLPVMGIFAPLSLVAGGVTSTFSQKLDTNARKRLFLLGLSSFLIQFANVMMLGYYLLTFNFGGVSIPIAIFPISLGMLFAGVGLTIMSFAELI
jgi:hypothetical protein